jgi:hypothetical protein
VESPVSSLHSRRSRQLIVSPCFSAQFCLTELGHGLDIVNLETTAELMQSGDICLNTPSLSAAKSVMSQ